jgi:EAL domain-containing protein (putative c-di-GMP-specific phosphodiesterase class I)
MSAILQETALAGELRQMLAEGLVRAVYQPIVDLDNAEVVGYEANCQWRICREDRSPPDAV